MFRFVAGLLAALSVILLAEIAAAEPVGPDVPKEITIPPGHKLVHKAQARGVQIYRAMAGSSGNLEWVLEAPLAGDARTAPQETRDEQNRDRRQTTSKEGPVRHFPDLASGVPMVSGSHAWLKACAGGT